MYEKDRWANGPWVNCILGKRRQGQKKLGKRTVIHRNIDGSYDTCFIH